ncbi:hypothetical protein L3Q82_013340, partial [Scortum barcoo]
SFVPSVVAIRGENVSIRCDVTPKQAEWSHCAVDVKLQPICAPECSQLNQHFLPKCHVSNCEGETGRNLDLCLQLQGQGRASFSKSDCKGLKEVGFEDAGRYRCSGTIKGQRLSQNMQLVTAKSGLSGQKSSGVSRNTAAIVSLSFLLLVLLLVLAQMYKNHQR